MPSAEIAGRDSALGTKHSALVRAHGVEWRVALSSTIYNVSVDLSDVDRGLYQSIALRMAMHPSESMEYMTTRLMAYCLEYTDGIEMTAGLSDGNEPAIVVRDGRRAAPLAAAAAHRWPARHLQLVGVTGTNGKTTTVNMLRHVGVEKLPETMLISLARQELPKT